jgi:phosphonate transport system substrate-binding protein
MKIMKRYNLMVLLLMVGIALVIGGCDNRSDKEVYEPRYADSPAIHHNVFIFGVHPLHNPQRLFEVYQPLVDYLNKRIPDIEIRLEASRNYDEYDNKLFSAHFDFALPNPYQTVKSTEHGYRIFGKMGDDHNFRGILLVRKDSKINEVGDLKGKSVSYPAPTALAATMMPQRFLHDRGIDIGRDIKNLYVGSQESSIMNVYLKKSAAASTWPPPWIAFAKERPEIANELKVIWETTPLVNNGLVVKKEIDPALVDQIARLIFELHTTKEGRDILKPMNLSRFEKADDTTYAPVRDFLKAFERDIRPIRITP